MNKKFEVFVEDVGDRSVGLSPLVVMKAELDENFVEHLKENNLMKSFETKLKKLVDEFFEPEIRYEIYDTDYLEAEKQYWEDYIKEM